jgi:hypothetical protein
VWRTEKRQAMARKVVNVILGMNDPQPFVTDPRLGKKIADARIDVQLYGTLKEQEVYEQFVRALENKDGAIVTERQRIDEVLRTLEELKVLVLKTIREETGLTNVQ